MKTIFTRILIPSIILMFSLCSFASNKDKEATTFSKKKPYTVEIAQCSTLRQAYIITERLTNNDIQSYILKQEIKGKEVYSVVSGAFENIWKVNIFKNQLYKTIGTRGGKTLSYATLPSESRVPIKKDSDASTNRNDTNHPKINTLMQELINQYPSSNMFDLKGVFWVTLNKQTTQLGGRNYYGEYHYYTPNIQDFDLKDYMEFGFSTFGSVTYIDNLCGDETTVQSAKLTNPNPEIYNRFQTGIKSQDFSLFKEYQLGENTSSDLIITLSSFIADSVIIKKGNSQHLYNKKEAVEIDNGRLIGYKVSSKQTGKEHQTIYLLCDRFTNYLHTITTNKEKESELLSFLSQIGKGNGLDNYDEFRNLFYRLPDRLSDDEELVAHISNKEIISINKNATDIENEESSELRKMTKDDWRSFSIYNHKGEVGYIILLLDLQTVEKGETFYQLFSKKHETHAIERVEVHGEKGCLDTDKLIIDFLHGQYYVSAFANKTLLSKDDFIERIERLQLQKGIISPK